MTKLKILIKKENRIKKQIAKNSFVWEYPLHNKKLEVALARINGRFPDSGKTVNKVCQEIYYVISGSGKIFIEGKEFKLNKGDAFLIKPKKKYHVSGKNLFLVCSTSPAWYPKQQKLIEK